MTIHRIAIFLALLVLAPSGRAEDKHLRQIERIFYEMRDHYSDYDIADLALLVSFPEGTDASAVRSWYLEMRETNPDTVAFFKKYYSRIGVVDLFREKGLALVITSRLEDSKIEYEFFWLISRTGDFHSWGLLPDTRYLTSVANGIDKRFRGYADEILGRVARKYPSEHFDAIGTLLEYAGRATESRGAESGPGE